MVLPSLLKKVRNLHGTQTAHTVSRLLMWFAWFRLSGLGEAVSRARPERPGRGAKRFQSLLPRTGEAARPSILDARDVFFQRSCKAWRKNKTSLLPFHRG